VYGCESGYRLPVIVCGQSAKLVTRLAAVLAATTADRAEWDKATVLEH